MLGIGQRERQSYKVTHDGKYGNIDIDLPSVLRHHRLIEKKGGEIVINLKVDHDLLDLLNKRYNNKKVYSKLSQNLFNQLTELSELPNHQNSSNYSKTLCDPEDLINQLECIC